jgi:GT2 family glycosyltransferase
MYINKKIDMYVYLCDDGSTDGTSEHIKMNYPQVVLVYGDGNLFWAKGMAKAMGEAINAEYDYYLMVNDDVEFFDDMIETMMRSYKKCEICAQLVAIVGATKDKFTDEWTYGGQIWNKKLVHERYDSVFPADNCPECNMTNWNCFLIPEKMIARLGAIDDYYEHAKADNDYSNRIINSGNKIFVADRYIGTCQRNSLVETWRDTSLGLRKRFKLVSKPNGLPFRSELHYCIKFHKWTALIWFLKRYVWIVISYVKCKVMKND